MWREIVQLVFLIVKLYSYFRQISIYIAEIGIANLNVRKRFLKNKSRFNILVFRIDHKDKGLTELGLFKPHLKGTAWNAYAFYCIMPTDNVSIHHKYEQVNISNWEMNGDYHSTKSTHHAGWIPMDPAAKFYFIHIIHINSLFSIDCVNKR